MIRTGLSENDKILLEGVQKVKENDKIKYEFQSPKESNKSFAYQKQKYGLIIKKDI